jgi:ATP-dependent DNA helicase DinG
MDARKTFVNLFTDAAQDKSKRPNIQIVDGYWRLSIKGDNTKHLEMTRAACVPSHAEQTIEGDTLTARWPSIADQIFGEGGVMAKALPGYEVRAPQLHMARVIQRSIEMGEPAIIEAGTGTGKSFAYAAVAMAMNKRCVISTSNKALQAQLYQKDIPFLCGLFPGKKVALAQGKSNYLCRANCETLGKVVIDNYTLAEWYNTTETGNVEELDFHVAFLSQWTVGDDCTGKRCPFYHSCFYYKAKAERQDADVIICNHALLILDRLYPQAAILPGCEVVVVDEAHKLADYARNALGQEFTIDMIKRALDETFHLVPIEHSSATATAEGMLQEFHAEISAYCVASKDRQIGVKHEDEFEPGQKLATELTGLAGLIWNPEDKPEDDDGFKRSKKAGKIQALAEKIGAFSRPTVEGFVRWIEPETNKMINLPFNVADFIGAMAGFSAEEPPTDPTHCALCGRSLTAAVYVLDGRGYGPDCIHHVDLFGDAEILSLPEWHASTEEPPEPRHNPTAIVFTSATMATATPKERGAIAAPDLLHFMQECGLSHGFQMIADSPFDYAANALLYVPNGETPTPKSDKWQSYMVDDVRQLVNMAQGGAFLLFTSHTHMNYAVSILSNRFEEWGLKVLVQGKLPKGEIIKQFKANGNAVLFATKSFWEGVSIEGAALRLVVIDKTPFQPPSPLLKAREAAVESAFRDIHLPEMIIDLKQGSGRLIRRMDDYGVIAILDSRVRLSGWGRESVLPSLPPAKLTHEIATVADFFQRRREVVVEPLEFPVNIDKAVWDELDELGF